MKYLLTLVTAFALMAGAAQAGCGKKVTSTGTLKAYDAAKKTLTVAAGGKNVTLRLTPQSKATGVKGMIGKKVTVISEHKKVDSVKPAKS